jgi:hypothetical protein
MGSCPAMIPLHPRDPDATLDGVNPLESPVGHPLPQGDPCGLGQVQMFR